ERVPIHCSSAGTIFLAFMSARERKLALAGKLQRYSSKTILSREKLIGSLDEVRRKGIAFADETYLSGIRGTSVPVFGSDRDVIAVVSMLAPSPRLSIRGLAALGPEVKRTAQAISEDLVHASVTPHRARSSEIRAAE